jgi:hypothetical protein
MPVGTEERLMIEMFKRHLDNDIKQIKDAWNNMDTLSHVLVIMFITLIFMVTDKIAHGIHF